MEIKELNLKNKVALITGGAGGIGKSIVENFAHYGASVVVADKSSERCEELQQILKKCSKNYLVECIDVTQKNEVKKLIKLIETQFNRLDIVVNNVGDFLELIKPFEELDDSEIEDLYSVNLKSMFMVTSEALHLIKKNNVANSSIINISSIEAFRGIPRATVYSSFKHAITGFTRSLALELAPSQIKVNAIAPETTETIQVQPKKAIAEKYHDHIERWNPYGRFGKPSDAAGSALFLASDLSSWVTGATINLDGGALAAAGWYRDPDNSWTIAPVISDDGFNYK